MKLKELRIQYHNDISDAIIRSVPDGQSYYYNFADKKNLSSRQIAEFIVNKISADKIKRRRKGKATGTTFERITRSFIEESFTLLNHLRPGKWHYSTTLDISKFNQYKHLEDLAKIILKNKELTSTLGTDYIVKPDIIIARHPVSDDEINQTSLIIPEGTRELATRTPLRSVNIPINQMSLHASISCKWTIRSDRSQNARTEALNLIRNRKGRLPYIVAVTAEPLPTRIASLALGTGDLDCVYHFALYELQEAITQLNKEDQLDMLNTLVDGCRLRDISDLPFDLAI